MQALAVLFLLGWLVSTPWAILLVVGVILIGLALIAWVWTRQVLEMEPAAAAWTRVEPRFEPRTNRGEPTERLTLLNRIEQLERDLGISRSEVASLRFRGEQLERDLHSARTIQPKERANPMFRRVGLDEAAPDWVVKAVRTAYRKRLHPDAHPESRKVEAERRFKDAERAFHEILKVRGIQL
jgi:hypothetical protein